MRRWLLSATCWMCEYPAVPKPFAGLQCTPRLEHPTAKCPKPGIFYRGGTKPKAGLTPLTCRCLHRLRSGYSTKDYSLTGLVWNAVNLSPEQLGHGVSLKVTVVCDSLREPLTFTCDCKCPTPRNRCRSPLAGIGAGGDLG